TPLYWHYFRAIGQPKAAMRVGDWMILGHWDGPAFEPSRGIDGEDCQAIKSAKLVEFELYNVASDMAQANNLAGSEPEKLKELSAKLVRKYAEVQEAVPIWDAPAERNTK